MNESTRTVLASIFAGRKGLLLPKHLVVNPSIIKRNTHKELLSHFLWVCCNSRILPLRFLQFSSKKSLFFQLNTNQWFYVKIMCLVAYMPTFPVIHILNVVVSIFHVIFLVIRHVGLYATIPEISYNVTFLQIRVNQSSTDLVHS